MKLIQSIICSSVLAGSILSAQAALITIINPGFDTVSGVDNPFVLTDPVIGYVYTNTLGSGVTFNLSNATGPASGNVLGWTTPSTLETGVAVLGTSYVSVGTSNGLFGYMTGGTNNILRQTLSDTLVANTIYTLTIAAYARTGTQPGSGFTVDLWAGSTNLTLTGWDGGQSRTPATLTNTFQNFTFTYTSPDSGPTIGQALKIEFTNLTVGSQVGVDNVSLNAMAVPEPSTWALMAFGLAAFMLRRRKALISHLPVI